METYFLTALQPDPVVAWYFLKFWRECVSKTGAHLFLFWSGGVAAQKNLPDCVWLKDVRDHFFREFMSSPNVSWYEQGFEGLENKPFAGNLVTHFDALDYMFGDVPDGSITVSYDSDVWWWDLLKLKYYLSLIEEDKFDIVGTTPAGCGTQIQEEVSKRQPPANIHPCFVVIKTDNLKKVTPQAGVDIFGRPVRWSPYVWEPGVMATQFNKVITESTRADVFGWASIELIDRLGLNRFYEIKPSPRYQEVYDSFIGEPGWVHPAATSPFMYTWPSIQKGLDWDIPKWTRRRVIFGVARHLLGFRRLLSDKKFMALPTARACISESQESLEFMCKIQEVSRVDLRVMTDRILNNYPL